MYPIFRSAHKHEYSLPTFERVGTAFWKLIEEGKVLAPKFKTVTLDEVPAALQSITTQRTVGKLVLIFRVPPVTN